MKKMKFVLFIIMTLFTSWETAAFEVKAVDGDSLEIGARRIRLDGIDAPELRQVCRDDKGNDYFCGEEALHYLKDLISEKNIDCRCLPQKDRYHREICECFADGYSLNKAMVQAGWAVTYRDKTYLDEEQTARLNKSGIWQGKNMRPAIYRALHKFER